MKRLLIVANRLPVKAHKRSGRIEFTKSAGGLATGLDSLTVNYEKHWIGWPGIMPKDTAIKDEVTRKLNKDLIHPVFLTYKELSQYYEGFSNKTLWPLFHYFLEYTEYSQDTYECYKNVNELFCEKVLEVAQPEDIIWVQDYHLMLLPGMLRQHLTNNEIGFFLHIPFPSYELFRTLPWRKELLAGLLGSDLIGFHTYEYMRHFMSAIYRILGMEPHLGSVNHEGRNVQVDTFPMGINYDKFFDAPGDKEVKKHIVSFRQRFGENKTILSVDRLDYSKGILNRLRAYDKFLSNNPKYKGKLTLIVVLVPSRDQVEQYQSLKEEIDETVGNINGKYSTMRWTPIHYFYRSLPFEQLSALYHIADVALVTPLRDGMNLVAKEYVASKTDGKGVLILSEMAGAAIELEGAHIINPNDISDIVDALKSVLEMPEEEQIHRMRNMQRKIQKQTVQKWAKDFIGSLDDIRVKQQKIEKKVLSDGELEKMYENFSNAQKRLLLLDYDGTLVPFSDNPRDAAPDDDLLDTIEKLTEHPSNRVVIISGRDHNTLSEWFNGMAVEMIAEHGTWFKEKEGWTEVQKISNRWKSSIHPILQEFVDKTPGSFIEEKPHSLVWHYRKTDSWIGDIRAQELINTLIYPCTKRKLEILDGNKVIEVKISGIDKGTATRHWLKKQDWDFIFAIGDDRTDEDIFKVLPESAYSVKVGFRNSFAKYSVESWRNVRIILSQMASSDKPVKSIV